MLTIKIIFYLRIWLNVYLIIRVVNLIIRAHSVCMSSITNLLL